MSRRTIAILLLIIGLIVLSFAAVVLLLQQNQPTGNSTTTTEEDGAAPPDGQQTDVATEDTPPIPDDTVGVVVSLQTVPRGHVMTADILDIDRRPADTVDSNVITDTQDVIGMFARTDIYQGQTLTKDKFVGDIRQISEVQYGPSSLIPPGFVAQAVPLTTASLNEDRAIPSVGYGISEGDYVDILLLFQMHQLDEEFQTFLPNDAAFFVEEYIESIEESIANPEEETEEAIIFVISPYGRFEQLPTGDLAHIGPSGAPEPFVVGMVIQNAKVIQVGQYMLPEPAVAFLPTPTATAVPEGEAGVTPTPGGVPGPTATPLPPDVLTVALQPQQQLLLRYAIEVGADIDFALRGLNDGQLYAIDNVDLNFLLNRFNIEMPPNFGYSVDLGDPFSTIELTPSPVPPSSATGEDN